MDQVWGGLDQGASLPTNWWDLFMAATGKARIAITKQCITWCHVEWWVLDLLNLVSEIFHHWLWSLYFPPCSELICNLGILLCSQLLLKVAAMHWRGFPHLHLVCQLHPFLHQQPLLTILCKSDHFSRATLKDHPRTRMLFPHWFCSQQVPVLTIFISSTIWKKISNPNEITLSYPNTEYSHDTIHN